MMRAAASVLCLLVLLIAILNAIPLITSKPFIYERQDTIPKNEFGLVLGAGLTPDGEPSPVLQDRLDTALRLYRAQKVRHLILSGDGQGLWYNEVRTMHKYLIARGVDPNDLILDPNGRTTWLSIHNARQRNLASVTIFTQHFHLPRAIYLARSQGINAIGFDDTHKIFRQRWWFQWRELWARALAVVQQFSFPQNTPTR